MKALPNFCMYCHAKPNQPCLTTHGRRPTRPHKWRIEDAKTDKMHWYVADIVTNALLTMVGQP